MKSNIMGEIMVEITRNFLMLKCKKNIKSHMFTSITDTMRGIKYIVVDIFNEFFA